MRRSTTIPLILNVLHALEFFLRYQQIFKAWFSEYLDQRTLSFLSSPMHAYIICKIPLTTARPITLTWHPVPKPL